MKGAIRIPVTILLSLVVFILVLFAIYYIFGSPECDDLANTTAFHLMNTINEVSNDDFPYWSYSGEVPDDEDIAYYRKSPIRLCQQRFGAYEAALRFFGGEPEYKIYYEKFPEGGRLWRENYPWGGGAGSTLVFWFGLKAVSTGAELAAKAPLIWKGIKRVWKLRRAASHMEEINDKLFDLIFRPSKLLDDVDFQNFLLRFKTVNSREALQVSLELTNKQFDEIVEGLEKAGMLKKSGNFYLIKGTSFVTDDTQRPLTMTTKSYNEYTGSWEINHDNAVGYLRCDSCPGGVDLSDGKKGIVLFEYDFANNQIKDPLGDYVDPNDYYFPTTSGREQMQDIIDELKRSPSVSDRMRARELEALWAVDDAGAILAAVDDLDTLMKTNFYNDIFYKAGPLRFNDELTKLARGIDIEGEIIKFNSEKTVLMFSEFLDDSDNGMLKGLENLYDGTQNIYDDLGVLDPTAYTPGEIQQAILDVVRETDLGIGDKIYAMGISETVTPKADDYLNALIDPQVGLLNPNSINSFAGIGIQPGNFRVNAYMGVTDAILDGLTEDATLAYVKTLPNFADVNLNDNEIRAIYRSLDAWYLDPLGGNNIPEKMSEGWFAKYIVDWVDGKAVNAGWADIEDGFIIGLYKLDSRPWYVKWSAKYNKYKRYPKMVWFKARNLVTPTNPIAMGIFLGQYEGCLGNSLCVYSHGSLSEYPFYLNASAKDYFIRIWRPVSAWAQWAGWSTILMGVPEHPRFYVVGPCFAEAKVWKARYNGEDTIFIKPEKFDLNDTASNYCYADTDLINAYTWAWFASDVTDAAQLVIMGTKKFGSETLKKTLEKKIFSYFEWVDPSALLQAGIEYFLNWPGEPFKPLTWEEMVTGATQVPIEKAREAKEEAEESG